MSDEFKPSMVDISNGLMGFGIGMHHGSVPELDIARAVYYLERNGDKWGVFEVGDLCKQLNKYKDSMTVRFDWITKTGFMERVAPGRYKLTEKCIERLKDFKMK
jgi:hypothetical protein